MTENHLARIAHIFAETNNVHFNGVIPTPTFRLNSRMLRAGRCQPYRGVLEIAVRYHDHYGWSDELVRTVKHEATHLYLGAIGHPVGHTREFRTICARIGGADYSQPMPSRPRRPRGNPDAYAYAQLHEVSNTLVFLGEYMEHLAGDDALYCRGALERAYDLTTMVRDLLACQRLLAVQKEAS